MDIFNKFINSNYLLSIGLFSTSIYLFYKNIVYTNKKIFYIVDYPSKNLIRSSDNNFITKPYYINNKYNKNENLHNSLILDYDSDDYNFIDDLYP